MDTRLPDPADEPLYETPEDVAILYSWANLHGAKYRDFSASRREYRAQVRQRAAEELREAELRAKSEAESAASEAERFARESERAARSSSSDFTGIDRERALEDAEEAVRRAASERVEAARRAESAALAEVAARREQREITDAHASAERQAARWNDSAARHRSFPGQQPSRPGQQPARFAPAGVAPGLAHDPYESGPHGSDVADASNAGSREAADSRESGLRVRDEFSRVVGDRRSDLSSAGLTARRPQGYRPDVASGVRSAFAASRAEELARALEPARAQDPASPNRETAPRDPAIEANSPAWVAGNAPAPSALVTDTLQYSRERVAARWFALKGVFEPGQGAGEGASRPREARQPVLAVFSLAGGTGKTSLVATLGRTLSANGERVLLADTAAQGLLPYYFGASELRPGAVRTFSPPPGSDDASISLVSYNLTCGRASATRRKQCSRSLGATLRARIAFYWTFIRTPSGCCAGCHA